MKKCLTHIYMCSFALSFFLTHHIHTPHMPTLSHIHTITLYTLTGYPYTLHITTGDRPGAATNANVYVVLHGREGESGKVWVESGRRSLLAGQTDKFEVHSPQLVSPLEQVTVGHDNSGVGPGWFLEQVRV